MNNFDKNLLILNIAGLGPKTFKNLYQYYKSSAKIVKLSQNDFVESGMRTDAAANLFTKIQRINIEKELDKIKKNNIKVIDIFSHNYPEILKEISNPPYILYFQGTLPEKHDFNFAVVGTRKMTPYGKIMAEKIVYGLSKNKITIVSGLALGIDSIAHKIALKNETKTIAVLGTGLDNIYPSINTKLAQEIIKSDGLILSEFPLGSSGFKGNFPQRNRIISGLSQGVLVVEAAIKSGALITAYYALEQNREVFAIPGSLLSPQSEGCNNLIKLGAKLVTNHKDILDEFNLHEAEDKNISFDEIKFHNSEEKLVYNVLFKDQALHIDKIASKTNLAIPLICSAITMLEIKGLIKNVGGQNYLKK